MHEHSSSHEFFTMVDDFYGELIEELINCKITDDVAVNRIIRMKNLIQTYQNNHSIAGYFISAKKQTANPTSIIDCLKTTSRRGDCRG